MKKKKLSPIHPGEILLEEFLKPMGLSQNKLALNSGIGLQSQYELDVTADALGEGLEKEVRIYS
jgi:antitoxin HigA-1